VSAATLQVSRWGGTRVDPHHQVRSARSAPLLLHSLTVFRELLEPLLDARGVRTVVEVGVESGAVSGVYRELGAETVYCVDPAPSAELRESLAARDGLTLVERASPEVLAELPVADLYVLDGDHNHATVRGELDWILHHAPDALVLLHDVLWPWGRRDLYYQPSSVADPHPSSDDGPTVWADELTPAGFVGLGAFRCAREAGGERNGVLTAVEDALAAHRDEWTLRIVPAVFGLGVLVRRGSAAEQAVLDVVRPYADSELLATMEDNRIALYTRVLQLQYEAAAAHERLHELQVRVVAQVGELAAQAEEVRRSTALAAARRRRIAELEAALRQARRPRVAAGVAARGLLRRITGRRRG
jgi:hypothetical protein